MSLSKFIINIMVLLVVLYIISDALGVGVPYGRMDRWQKDVTELYANPPQKPELFDLPVPYMLCLDNGQSDGCIDYKKCVFESKSNEAMTVRCFGAEYGKIKNDNGRGFRVHGFPNNPSYIERIW